MSETAAKHPAAGQFISALEENAGRYEVALNGQALARLAAYYEQVMAWNARLHLVAPCSPAEFATRHVLESLLALPHLPDGARVADVGSGAGLPIIPCLVARPDLTATLFEASQKKSVFLREALRRAGTGDAAKVVNERFEKTPTPAAPFITCRAIERFAEMFPQLYEWSPRRSRLLLFAGEAIRVEIEKAALPYRAILIPASERRYLFIVDRDTTGDNAGRNSHPAAS